MGLKDVNKTHEIHSKFKSNPVGVKKFKKQNSLVPISKELFEHPDTQAFLKNSKLTEGMVISIVDSKT